MKEALAARPELQTLRLQEQIHDKLIDVAAADAKPRVDFDGSLRLCGAAAEESVRLGLLALVWRRSRVKVPLFDGWRTAGRVAQAQRRSATP